MKKSTSFLFALLLCCLFSFQYKISAQSTVPQSSQKTATQEKRKSFLIYRDESRFIEETTNYLLEKATENQLVFNGSNEQLKNIAVGDIMVSTKPDKFHQYGYLFKVIAVNTNNGKTIFEVERAELTDYLIYADLNIPFMSDIEANAKKQIDLCLDEPVSFPFSTGGDQIDSDLKPATDGSCSSDKYSGDVEGTIEITMEELCWGGNLGISINPFGGVARYQNDISEYFKTDPSEKEVTALSWSEFTDKQQSHVYKTMAPPNKSNIFPSATLSFNFDVVNSVNFGFAAIFTTKFPYFDFNPVPESIQKWIGIVVDAGVFFEPEVRGELMYSLKFGMGAAAAISTKDPPFLDLSAPTTIGGWDDVTLSGQIRVNIIKLEANLLVFGEGGCASLSGFLEFTGEYSAREGDCAKLVGGIELDAAISAGILQFGANARVAPKLWDSGCEPDEDALIWCEEDFDEDNICDFEDPCVLNKPCVCENEDEFDCKWRRFNPTGENSCKCLGTPYSQSPDNFLLKDASLESNIAVVNDIITANVTHDYIENSGDPSPINAEIGFFLSTDQVLDADEMLNSKLSNFIELDFNMDFRDEVSLDLTIPGNTPSGNYFILFVSDYLDLRPENNEDDNFVAVPITIINNVNPGISNNPGSSDNFLIEDAFIEPGIAMIDENITANVTHVYVNSTGYPSEIDAQIGFFLSTNPTLDDCDKPLESTVSNFIEMGLILDDTDDVSIDITLPANTVSGDYFILFVSDFLDLIPEFNEIDNLAAVPITVINNGNNGDPDSSDNFLIEDASIELETTMITETITAYATHVYINSIIFPSEVNTIVGFFLSNDQLFDDCDELLGTTVSNFIEFSNISDDTDEISIDLTLPGNTPSGDYFILFISDYLDLKPEFNESDNLIALPITVINNGNPDSLDNFFPILTKVNLPTCFEETCEIGVEVTHSYQSSMPSFKNVSLGYYLSGDRELDNNDILLGVDFSNFGSNESDVAEEEEATFLIPPNAFFSDYYILFVSDILNEHVEYNEFDNTASEFLFSCVFGSDEDLFLECDACLSCFDPSIVSEFIIRASDPCNCFDGIDLNNDNINDLAKETFLIIDGIPPFTITNSSGNFYDNNGNILTNNDLTNLINNATLTTWVDADGQSTYSITIEDLSGSTTTVSGGPCDVCSPEDQEMTGCTDPAACNYDPVAVADNESCFYPFTNFDCNGNCLTEVDCENVCDGTSIIGSNCDDEDDSTINDAYDMNCNCVGELTSTCDDGIQNGTETDIDCGGECEPCEQEPTNFNLSINDPCDCNTGIDLNGDGQVDLVQEEIIVTGGVAPYTVTASSNNFYDATGNQFNLIDLTNLLNNSPNNTALVYVFADGQTTHSVTVEDSAGNQATVNGGSCQLCGSNDVATIPTLSQWGVIILLLLIITTSGVFIIRQQHQLATAGLGSSSIKLPLINWALFNKILIKVLPFILVAIALITLFEGAFYIRNVIGSFISSFIIIYLVHFVIMSERFGKDGQS